MEGRWVVVGVFAGNGIVVRDWTGLDGSQTLVSCVRRSVGMIRPESGIGVIGLASRCT